MSNHDKFQLILMAAYVVLMVLAWRDGSIGKCVYWLDAFVLSVGLMMQKG